jgi:hypothetical protein
MSRTYHHDAKHRSATTTRRRNSRGHVLPTAEQRILELLAAIPPLRPDPDHTALAALVDPADWTRPMPATRTPTTASRY